MNIGSLEAHMYKRADFLKAICLAGQNCSNKKCKEICNEVICRENQVKIVMFCSFAFKNQHFVPTKKNSAGTPYPPSPFLATLDECCRMRDLKFFNSRFKTSLP